MKRYLAVAVVLITLCGSGHAVASRNVSLQKARRGVAQAPADYYPPRGDGWRRKRPEQVGMDSALLEQAVRFARTKESRIPRDFSTQVETFGALLGPLPKERGETNGMAIRRGYVAVSYTHLTLPTTPYV